MSGKIVFEDRFRLVLQQEEVNELRRREDLPEFFMYSFLSFTPPSSRSRIPPTDFPA